MTYIDTHAHLQLEAFADDWKKVLDRSCEQGVTRVLLPGSDLEDSRKGLAMASAEQRFWCSAGCHPHEAANFTREMLDQLEQIVVSGRNGPLVAVGEIGLDYHYDFSPRDVQQTVFDWQIDLAHKYELPLIIHSREATADTLRILDQAADRGLLLEQAGVFHCFSGSLETAKRVIAMGFYLGFDGPVTFKNARRALEVIQMCPRDRLLLETDSPFLAPVPYRGKRNEPGWLPLIAEKIADLWQVSIEEVAAVTTENALRLFQ